MKFGIISNKPLFKHITTATKYNIGDNVQAHAIENLYRYMGIPQSDIIYINKYELASYDGEYTVVPMSAYFSSIPGYGSLPTSNKIIPVFISFHMSSEECDESMFTYFRNYQPIGCRDEKTMTYMRQNNVLAYLSGCITITLPKRKVSPGDPKIFFIDTPESLLPYIPDEIKQNAEFCSHLYNYQKAPLDDDEAKRMDDFSRERYQTYANEATLVVTSRLHAASPCYAMGIPTIVTTGNYSIHYGWVDKYLKVYTPDIFSEINWTPEAADIEAEKKIIMDVCARQIQKAYDGYKDIMDLSAFYESRQKGRYDNNILDMLEKYKAELGDKPFRYAVWGATTSASTLFRCAKEVFDNSELVTIIDEYMDGTFCGKQIERSSAIKNMDDDVLFFIATRAGKEYAENILDRENKKHVYLSAAFEK